LGLFLKVELGVYLRYKFEADLRLFEGELEGGNRGFGWETF